jgi:hypothetical protein
VADPVPRVRRRRVREVLAVADLFLRDVVVNLLPADGEHRADDREPVADAHRLHPRKPGGTGAAEELKQARLDLVVAVVREQKPAAPVTLRAFLKKGAPQLARGEFRRAASGLGKVFRPCAGELAVPGGAPDKIRIRARCPPAQPVVEVADDELLEPQRAQCMQKHHRIASAGDPDQKWPAPRVPGQRERHRALDGMIPEIYHGGHGAQGERKGNDDKMRGRFAFLTFRIFLRVLCVLRG